MDLTRKGVRDLYTLAKLMAKQYNVRPPMTDAIWVFSFEGELDYRLSDLEFVLHELAHAVVAGIPFTLESDLVWRWDKHSESMSGQDKIINELQVMSVVFDILEFNGVHDDGAVYDVINFSLQEHTADAEDIDDAEIFENYASTDVGREDVEVLVNICNYWVDVINKRRRVHKIKKLRSGRA